MSSPRKLSTRGGAPAQERELRAQGKKTMRKLLDAAMVVFERRGYHAARVDDIGQMGEQLLAQVAAVLIERIQANAPAYFDPQVAALAMVAMVERLHYYLLSRQLDVSRDQLLDTLATVLHVGVFGGSRRRRRRAAESA